MKATFIRKSFIMQGDLRMSQAKLWLRRKLSSVDTLARVMQQEQDFFSVRDQICRSGTDSRAYFGEDYTHEGGLYLQQNPDEFAALSLFLRKHRPLKNYMEIGTASGGTCLFLYREVGFTNVISIDDGLHPRATEQEKHLGQVPNLKRFIGSSHSDEAKEFLRCNLSDKLDVAFIDGDHSYEGVWQDIELTLPFCRSGAFIIFHDIFACNGVKKAWNECIKGKVATPIAEYISERNPMGIGVCRTI